VFGGESRSPVSNTALPSLVSLMMPVLSAGVLSASAAVRLGLGGIASAIVRGGGHE
jgi:hypothetical protein